MEFFAEYKTIWTILHLLGVVVGFGAAITADTLFFKFLKDLKLSKGELDVMSWVSKVVWIGLSIILLSGILLFLSNVQGYLASSKFLIKMFIVLFIALNGTLLHFYIKPRLKLIDWESAKHDKKRRIRKISFAAGAVSFNSWMLALILGVLDSIPIKFSVALLLYLGFLSVVIAASQILEIIFTKRFSR